MAVQYVGTSISGLAGDTKPTPSGNERGLIFVETDTNKIYQWDTDSWNEIIPSSAPLLTTARTIGGTSFNGSANIAVALATTATTLANARTIGGVSFDGSANIVPNTITVADSTDTTSFIAMFDSATGDLAPRTDAGITYNAGTGMLTATGFTGPLTGNVTGNVTGNASGTSATVTGATQAAITTVANVTTVGALDAGSITSGFGSIDVGSSAITTTGTITTGNLSVTGTTTTVNSTNTTISDRLIELASGASTGADSGIIVERGSTGNNAIIAWDESADTWTLGTTTATGSSTGDLTITTGTLVAALTGNVTGNVTGDVTGASGTAATVTGAAQSAITSVGTLTSLALSGNLTLADNDRIVIGTGSDFQIYHDGATNIIDGGGTADIKIQDSSHTSAIFDTSAEVQLYYDNAKKFETTAAGATITGALTTTDGIRWGNGGSYGAGGIYSDSNWGGILTAFTASPAAADWLIEDAASHHLVRIQRNSGAAIALAVGGVPNTDWANNWSVLQVGDQTTLSNYPDVGFFLANNARYDGSNWTYIEADQATNIAITEGKFQVRQAASGSANANITWTYPLTIPANGQFVVGGSTVAGETKGDAKLTVHGAIWVDPVNFTLAGDGNDTQADTGLVMNGYGGIFYWSNGYIRNIIKSVANNIIQIGQDGTSIWNTIDLIPGNAGKVRIYSDDPDSGSALLTATFDDGKLGVGATAPVTKTHLYASATTLGGPYPLLALELSDDGADTAAGEGPAISFYIADSTTDSTGAGTVYARKGAGNSHLAGQIATVRISPTDAVGSGDMVFATAENAGALAERMRIRHNGMVGIGITTGADHFLTVKAGSLGQTATNETLISRLGNYSANADSIVVQGLRNSNGTDWQTARLKMMRRVDVTDMGYIGFDHPDTGTVVFGRDATDHFTMKMPAGEKSFTISSGTAGDAVLYIEADTDNNQEADNPKIVFKQDGGAVIDVIGLIGNADDVATGTMANSMYFKNNSANYDFHWIAATTLLWTMDGTDGRLYPHTDNGSGIGKGDKRVNFIHQNYSYYYGPYDQIQFLNSSSNRIYMMAKISDNKAWALYSPDNGTSWLGYFHHQVGNADHGMFRAQRNVQIGGLLKIEGGSPGADKVLTSDASGNATWEEASGGGGSVTLTVANGETVTIGKGVAVNTSGEAIAFDSGTDVIPAQSTGMLMPQIAGVDSADSNWYDESKVLKPLAIYDYNANVYVLFFQYQSGRSNVTGSGNPGTYTENGTYPNVSSSDGDKPINTLLGSGNEIAQQYTWITAIGTLNANGTMTWGGFTKIPNTCVPAEPTNGRQWTAARGQYNSIIPMWDASQKMFVFWTDISMTGTSDRYDIGLSAAKYNASTGKLDYSTRYQVDADSYTTAGYPITACNNSESASDDRWVVYRRTSSSAAIQYNVVKLATFSAGQSIYDSIGSWITPHSSGTTPMGHMNAPDMNRIAIGFRHSANVNQWKLYTRSGNNLSLVGNQGVLQGGQWPYVFLRVRSTSTRADFLEANRSGSWYSNYYTAPYPFQITNAAHTSSSTFAMASHGNSQGFALYAPSAGGQGHISQSIGGAWQPDYIKTDGSLTETTGNLFLSFGSQIINVASGDALYHVGQTGWEDASLSHILKKYVVTYATTANNGNTSNSDLITLTSSDVWTRPASRREKFVLSYGAWGGQEDWFVINHWNQDRNMVVMMDNRYGAAIYKDNDNGQYTANSLKAYAENGVHYSVLNAGNANIETTPDWGADRIYLGVAQATVTGNGSNQVTVNIVGNIDTNQSGLTVGAKYYMNEKGDLVPHKPWHSPVDLEVGTAISATTLVLANNQNTSSMTVASTVADVLVDD